MDGDADGGWEDFDAFYLATYPRLVGQLLAVTGDLQDAEDVVQEAFIRAYQRWPGVRAYDVPERWVRRVALNLAVSQFRRTRRRLAVVRHLRVPESSPLSDEVLEVVEILRTLPITHRAVLLLHDVLELPVDEVAEQLGLPLPTVRGRLTRGRARLAKQLTTEAGEVRFPHG